MRKSETYRNEIKSYIVRTGMTMTEVVDYLSDEYGWSRSVPNLSGKLKRGSLRYGEAVELADALGYDIVWQKCPGCFASLRSVQGAAPLATLARLSQRALRRKQSAGGDHFRRKV